MSRSVMSLDAYTSNSKRIISAAQALADNRKNPEIRPAHLLFKLIEDSEAVRDAFQEMGTDAEDILVECELWLRRLPRVEKSEAFLSPAMLDILNVSTNESRSPLHLLQTTLSSTDPMIRQIVRDCGISTTKFTQPTPSSEPTKTVKRPRGNSADRAKDELSSFGEDLCVLAANGKMDPTIGRGEEVHRVIQILCRRRGHNPLLVGESGIGKRSIVRALANRIAHDDVPDSLKNKRLLALDLNRLSAGTRLKSEQEERMRNLLTFLHQSSGDVILFVENLGGLSGRGQSGAALLERAMARGEAQVIAVATPDEAQKVFDEHKKLNEHFMTIQIEEPSKEESVAVLRGLVSIYAACHGVTISDAALISASELAKRYIADARLPKSALDLIDEAAAKVRVEKESVPKALDQKIRELETLSAVLPSLDDEVDAQSVEISQQKKERVALLQGEISSLNERWTREISLRNEISDIRHEITTRKEEGKAMLSSLDEKLVLLEKELHQRSPLVHDVVGPEDVADVVALLTGIPVSKMLEEENQKLLRMEESLRRRVIGQNHALTTISKAVRRARIGLRDGKRPIGSFLFLGPTGVGKTELAKALAEFLFDDEQALTRLDMSEFMEKHMVARLLGAPPGYVDSDEGGFLTEAVRKRPYSVILFDEMEKAHPDVFNICLQLLDDGRLSDSRGRLAHFRDSVIIMTSNIGSDLILEHDGDIEDIREDLMDALSSHYRPEFLNRIDDIVIFNPLSKDNLQDIAAIQLRGIQRMLDSRQIKLEVDASVHKALANLGYAPAFGARPLKRVILKHIQDPLSETLLRGQVEDGSTIVVTAVDGKITFQTEPSTSANTAASE